MFEIGYAHGHGYFWHLKAANGEILCHSQVYTNKAAAQNGIASVRANASSALIRDNTQ